MADRELELAKQQLETSISQRKREQTRFPHGSRNGSQSDRANDKEYRNHKGRIDQEQGILDDVSRRLDDIKRNTR